MRGGAVLSAALALVLGAGAVAMGAPEAIAQDGRYRTQPSETPQVPVNLGLSVTVAPGTTRLVRSYLVVGDAGELTLVSALVYCRLTGSTSVTERIVTGQNVQSATQVTLLTRALVTAPATGALTCRLYALLVNHASTRATGTITVLAGTGLELVGGPIHSSAHSWQINKPLVNTSYRTAPVRFTPAAGARFIQAFGDVNATVCYYGDFKGPCLRVGARRSGSFGTVETQLVVQQLQANGAPCRTFVDGPPSGADISSTTHHLKLNTSISNIPVSWFCTSRVFIGYVRVTSKGSGNSIVVESNHQGETALYASS